MQDELITDPTFVREQWSGPTVDGGLFPETLPPAAGTVTTVNGIPGPLVSITGGSTGLSFSTGANPSALGGVLIEADGGTHQSTYTKGDLLVTPGGAVLNKLAVGTNGFALTADSTATNGVKWAAGTGGTVTSFSATPNGIFDVANPTTTPALSLDNQNANIVLAGPSSGGAATPSFRALVNADLPGQAWQSWTPTLTNITLGAGGTITGAYTQIGKYVAARLSIVLGTAGALTGTALFTLPVTSVSYPGTATAQPLGWAEMLDVGVKQYAGLVVWASTTTAGVAVQDSSGTYLSTAGTSATVPFTFGVGDEINCQFFYEAA